MRVHEIRTRSGRIPLLQGSSPQARQRTAAPTAVRTQSAVSSARDRGRRSAVPAVALHHPAERGMSLQRGAERAQVLRGRPGRRVGELRREHDRREERGGGQDRKSGGEGKRGGTGGGRGHERKKSQTREAE